MRHALLSCSCTAQGCGSPIPLPPNPQCRPLIRVFHEVSTFYANADQSFHWTDGSKRALKQKSLGQSIMVSDFIDEVSGFVQYGGQKARLLLEHQSEGYFKNDMLLEQVDRAVTIFTPLQQTFHLRPRPFPYYEDPCLRRP